MNAMGGAAATIERYLAALRMQDWPALAVTLEPDVERTGPFNDVYRGRELPNGMKSVAILVVMRDTERTLTDADGDRIVAGLLTTLTARFGATLRSQAAR